MMVKPVPSMLSILQKSGVPLSSSNDMLTTYKMPYLTLEEGSYRLVDPRKNTFYVIDSYHWFTQSPFLGGGYGLKFPIFTANIQDLENYSESTK